MKNGYWQKLLRIDLTNKKILVEPIAEEDLRRFIGGAGLAAEILRREVPAKIAPYDPKNLVIFGTGPFQGPAIPGGGEIQHCRDISCNGHFRRHGCRSGLGSCIKGCRL
ncbi:MAG: aldehyde ferredoxin oxidoreductase N-terminal domain-containing protein [Pseudomonadota bacterium]